jgi:hypothetical protein
LSSIYVKHYTEENEGLAYQIRQILDSADIVGFSTNDELCAIVAQLFRNQLNFIEIVCKQTVSNFVLDKIFPNIKI